MNQYFRMFFDIVRLRVAPQDLPASPSLVRLSLILYFLFSLAGAWAQLSPGAALGAAVVDTLLLTVMSYVLLWSRMHLARWPQTIIALAGSGALIGLLAIPLNVLQQQLKGEAGGVEFIPYVLILVLFFWQLVVIGHILRHALSTVLGFGLGLSTVYMYISMMVITKFFFPEATLLNH